MLHTNMNCCNICSKSFSTKTNLVKHLKKVHDHAEKLEKQYSYDATMYKCHECKLSYGSNENLRNHLQKEHSWENVTEYLTFNSFPEFTSWLHQEELTHNIQYNKYTGTQKNILHNTERIYMHCVRSGKAPQPQSRKRQVKCQGSCKINQNCTSQIIITISNASGICNVKYFKTHYGHLNDLQHLRLSKIDKDNVAAKLVAGVSVTSVLDTIRDNVSEEGLQRKDIITRKDILNIKQRYDINLRDGCRHADDATSVDLWVEQCSKEENNPVLFYKKQGIHSDELNDNDFCLILMNTVQQKLINKFGPKVICVDSTHGLNPYDFELTTILVVDEFNEGFPVASMFTNRKDTLIFNIFFSKIMDKVGQVRTKTFMTDITNTFYNAWCTVMGDAEHQLYCSWHVDRAWQSNLTKVNDPDKRKWVYKTLKYLQCELDEEKFRKEFTNFIEILRSDESTSNMGLYLTSNYLNNVEKWAYAFRKKCGISTNMHLEAMHKVIKYVYLDGKKIKRLDKALHCLQKYMRDKIFDRIIKLTKGKINKHHHEINVTHELSKNKCFDVQVDDNNFILRTTNETFVVSKIREICCQLKCTVCSICIHSYECSCTEYNIQYNICVHTLHSQFFK